AGCLGNDLDADRHEGLGAGSDGRLGLSDQGNPGESGYHVAALVPQIQPIPAADDGHARMAAAGAGASLNATVSVSRVNGRILNTGALRRVAADAHGAPCPLPSPAPGSPPRRFDPNRTGDHGEPSPTGKPRAVGARS